MFVSGSVSDTSVNTGTLEIGSVDIDLTQISSGPYSVGDSIAVTGTQPNINGIVLAKSTLLLTPSEDVAAADNTR